MLIFNNFYVNCSFLISSWTKFSNDDRFQIINNVIMSNNLKVNYAEKPVVQIEELNWTKRVLSLPKSHKLVVLELSENDIFWKWILDFLLNGSTIILIDIHNENMEIQQSIIEQFISGLEKVGYKNVIQIINSQDFNLNLNAISKLIYKQEEIGFLIKNIELLNIQSKLRSKIITMNLE